MILATRPECNVTVEFDQKIEYMQTEEVMALVRRNIRNLEPYSTARDECGMSSGVFLDANENPFGNGSNRYPDPRQKELKDRVAAIRGVPVDRIFIGNGSDEAIDLCYRIFCTPGQDNAVTIDPSYGMYRVAADINDIAVHRVPLGEDFSLPVDGLLDACDSRTKLMFVCSPNNPTGNSFEEKDIRTILENFRGILVADEAYIDFSSRRSLVSLIDEYPNLIVLQTLSKAFGMAGLRIGLAFGNPQVMDLFAKVKYPYNISSAAMMAASSLLNRDIRSEIDVLKRERERVSAELCCVRGIEKVWPSDANFLLVKVKNPRGLYGFLLAKKVIVRDRSSATGCAGCLRITIGTPQENDRLLMLVRQYFDPESPAGPQPAPSRSAVVSRKTAETRIEVEVDLDRRGSGGIDTGLKFLDHMLDQIAHHSGIYLRVKAEGDLQVDEHHTMEDVAIVLGEALCKAFGDKRGIERYGFALPMDESRAMVLLDLGGRVEFVWDVEFTREYVGDVPTEMFRHFFRSLGCAMKASLHISARGENNHHIAEGIFKAFARALKSAVRRESFCYDLASSKGVF